MAVTTKINQVSYTESKPNDIYPYTFKILDAKYMKLILVDTDGTERQITSGYTVNNSENGGTVHYPGLLAGQKLILYRDVSYDQDADLDTHWPFNVIQDMADKGCILDQQLKSELDRSIKVSRKSIDNEGKSSFDMTVPVPADEKNYGLRMTKDGFQLVNDPSEVYYDTVAIKNQAEAARDTAKAWAEENAGASPSLINGAKSSKQWAQVSQSFANDASSAKDTAVGAKNKIIDEGFNFAFENVAMMKASTYLDEGMIAKTAGYWDYNDGGGALYYIRQAKTDGTEDVTKPSAIHLINGLVAELIINGQVTPKMFGAKGNAIYRNNLDGKWYEDAAYTVEASDDTQAFKQAINSSHSVFIPSGDYKITDTLEIDRHVSVEGVGFRSRLHFESSTIIKAIYIHGNFDKEPWDFLQNVSLKNLIIDITNIQNSGEQSGIFLEYVLWNVFENIRVMVSSAQVGLYAGDGVMGSTFTNVICGKLSICGNYSRPEYIPTTLTFINLYASTINLSCVDSITFIQPIVEGVQDKFFIEKCRDIRIYGGHFEGTGTLYTFIGNDNRYFYSQGNTTFAFFGTYKTGVDPYINMFADGRGDVGTDFIVNSVDIGVLDVGYEYIRYNNGKLICFGKATNNGVGVGAEYTFPISFNDIPTVIVTGLSSTYVPSLSGVTKTSANARTYAIYGGGIVETSDPAYVTFIAIGTWK